MKKAFIVITAAMISATGPMAWAGDALDSTLRCAFQDDKTSENFTVYLSSEGPLRTGHVTIVPTGKPAITLPSRDGSIPGWTTRNSKITRVVAANSWLDLNGEQFFLVNRADPNPATNGVFQIKLIQKPVQQAPKENVDERDTTEEAEKIAGAIHDRTTPAAPTNVAATNPAPSQPADPQSLKMDYEGKIKFDFERDGYRAEAKKIVCSCGDLDPKSLVFKAKDCTPNIPGGG